MPIYTDDDFELDSDNGYLSGASADFEYEVELCRGDDYCGWEITSCMLAEWRFGGWELTRYHAVFATSEAEISAIEERVAKEILERGAHKETV